MQRNKSKWDKQTNRNYSRIQPETYIYIKNRETKQSNKKAKLVKLDIKQDLVAGY